MGYSARYHAASLAAVFLALAIGILIGVGFGRGVLAGTEKDLEKSLRHDLESARQGSADLSSQLGRAREFDQRVYPSLVGNLLRRRHIAILAMGGLPQSLSGDIESGLQPTGGRLTQVSVVRVPPDIDSLAAQLKRTRFRRLEANPELLEPLGRLLGRQLVTGGALARRLRDQLLSRASGRFGGVGGVILVRTPPNQQSAPDAEAAKRLESGLIAGIRATKVPAVAAERSGDADSSVPFFRSSQITTVDDLDLTAGKVAMVAALLGAEGSFGVKSTADRLLPELLTLRPRRGAGGGR
jgi:hypothetical protein